LQSITTLRALARAVPRTLMPHLRRHRAITRIAVAFVSLAVAMAVSLEGATALPTPAPSPSRSILPENIGVGLLATAGVTLDFAEPMDRSSVEATISIRPTASVRALWRADGRALQLVPASRWQTDTRYLVTVAADARRADGRELGEVQQVSFTTQTAAVVSDFALHYVSEPPEQVMRVLEKADAASPTAVQSEPPPDTASLVSTATTITIGFSTAMDRPDVARHLVLSPELPGRISWDGNSLIFSPSERLQPDTRYALTVAGAHDLLGNPLGGDASFSFTTRVGAQVVKISPLDGARDVTPTEVSLWFSQPMEVDSVAAALKVTDATSGKALAGKLAWNEAGTQLRFTLAAALAKGHTIVVSLAESARDTDSNAVSGSWSFRTEAPPAPAPTVRRVAAAATGPAAPADAVAFALWQINQSRAAYGFGPLQLDSAISAVASAHAWDMIKYGYFSHTGRDGSTVSTRLRAAGISFSWSGENICYQSGQSLRATLEWCHATFMSEPYPGYANHIGNILSGHYTRVGIGIAQSGSKIIVVWDFAG
jgi:uncharacterized protein YkwD